MTPNPVSGSGPNSTSRSISGSAYRLVVFDWDGTLMDSTASIVSALRRAARDLGLPDPGRERASHVIGLGMLDAVRIVAPTIADTQIPAFVDRYRHHYFRSDGTLAPFEGIVDLLDALAAAGVWLAVATGKSRAGLDRALDRLGWVGRFVTTRCADEGEPKPHPWMLTDICDELALTARELLMIGDTTHDLGMARAAEVDAIGVCYGAHRAEELRGEPALEIVASVEELRRALRRRVGQGLQTGPAG